MPLREHFTPPRQSTHPAVCCSCSPCLPISWAAKPSPTLRADQILTPGSMAARLERSSKYIMYLAGLAFYTPWGRRRSVLGHTPIGPDCGRHIIEHKVKRKPELGQVFSARFQISVGVPSPPPADSRSEGASHRLAPGVSQTFQPPNRHPNIRTAPGGAWWTGPQGAVRPSGTVASPTLRGALLRMSAR